ncbi:hypothetical protein HDZ31DRAFT_76766 [Schizophyllum fasciatum]
MSNVSVHKRKRAGDQFSDSEQLSLKRFLALVDILEKRVQAREKLRQDTVLAELELVKQQIKLEELRACGGWNPYSGSSFEGSNTSGDILLYAAAGSSSSGQSMGGPSSSVYATNSSFAPSDNASF